jgi:hypothetical protein
MWTTRVFSGWSRNLDHGLWSEHARSTLWNLEILARTDPDGVSGEIAAHFERAGLPEQAAPYYRRAADAARQVYVN